MLIYLSILLLLVTPLIILIIRLSRPGFLYHWLLALAAAGLALPLVLLSGRVLPQTLRLVTWQPEVLFPSSPVLLLDQISWPFAAGVASLLLAVVLTDTARPTEVDWSITAAELALAGWGLFAVLAGNPLTLLLAWTAIDLLSLTILLGEAKLAGASRRIVLQFSARLAGTFLLIAAGLIAATPGFGQFYAAGTPLALLLFFAAAVLRLGVFPVDYPARQEPVVRRGLDVLSQLIPAASALVLLVRAASLLGTGSAGLPLINLLLLLVGCIGLLAAAAWYLSLDEFEGRQMWILGTASLAMASGLRGLAPATLAWGLAALFAGAPLFLATVRNQRIAWILIAGLVAFTAFPFTPTWGGAGLFTAPFTPPLVLFLAVHILLLLGFARHTLRLAGSFSGLERWVVLAYPFGIVQLVLIYFGIGWSIRPEMAGLPLVYWLGGPLAILVAGIALFWMGRNEQVWFRSRLVIEPLFSLLWVGRWVSFLYQLLERLVRFLAVALEGEGGILWVLLWTLLVMLLLARF